MQMATSTRHNYSDVALVIRALESAPSCLEAHWQEATINAPTRVAAVARADANSATRFSASCPFAKGATMRYWYRAAGMFL